MSAAGAPRVSLIVRSVGRPELVEALASAGSQTYPRLAIVVVDATGGRHPPLPAHCGAHALTFVAGTAPRKRAAAANAGLDAADGDYVGFLDDDDLLLPTHVEGLVDALESDPGAILAFAIARELRPGGDAQRIGNERLTRLVLLEQCFFPPCAALFRRTLLSTCRFDESLDAAEDWDFWLQASRHGPFRFVPQETAVYRADRGRSAMSAGAGDVAQHWRDVVWSKWSADRDALVRELDATFDRALAFARRGEHARAAVVADEVLAIHPFHCGALCLRGTHRAMRGDFEAARRDFAEAVAADPDDTAALLGLAQASERLGRHDEAQSLYRRVLEREPGNAVSLAKLGKAAPSASERGRAGR